MMVQTVSGAVFVCIGSLGLGLFSDIVSLHILAKCTLARRRDKHDAAVRLAYGRVAARHSITVQEWTKGESRVPAGLSLPGSPQFNCLLKGALFRLGLDTKRHGYLLSN